jgi:hypothetical protein
MPHEEAVREFLREGGERVEVTDVTGAPWIEIDFPGDVIRAAQEILPLLYPLTGTGRIPDKSEHQDVPTRRVNLTAADAD